MENRIIDIINFNSEASCLSSTTWFDALRNGKNSLFIKWLKLYIENEKKVVIGFPGATILDIAVNNQEVIELINKHPDIFEIIRRPFTHDISLLRSKKGFELNMEYGSRIINKYFINISDYYLPPEFMCNSLQIQMLEDMGIKGIFINPGRFDREIRKNIPNKPYYINGIFGSRLLCIPIDEELTNYYLHSIHYYTADRWNVNILKKENKYIYSWRDGESTFLLPDTLERERNWLINEDKQINRYFLNDVLKTNTENKNSNSNDDTYIYPIHPFSSWVKEMKMYWYISKVEEVEKQLEHMNNEQIYYWLHLISSDILSSIEKRSPIINYLENLLSVKPIKTTLRRQNKGLEGEEYLQILADYSNEYVKKYISNAEYTHINKLKDRICQLIILDRETTNE